MSATVGELELPVFDYTEPGLAGEGYHQRLAAVRQQGWLARSPLTYVVLDRESGEFFLRSRQTAFPGREIADIFGVTGGRLREMVDANILNATGERHRRLRALIGPSFTLRAADRWRPAMRDYLDRLWRELDEGRGDPGDIRPGEHAGCEFVAAFARPYPSLAIAAVLARRRRTRRGCTNGPAGSRSSSTSAPWPASPPGWSAPPGNCTTTSRHCWSSAAASLPVTSSASCSPPRTRAGN